MNVPQTGTGSGYSTALLEHLTGNEGTIVSLDIELKMAEWAKKCLRENRIYLLECVRS